MSQLLLGARLNICPQKMDNLFILNFFLSRLWMIWIFKKFGSGGCVGWDWVGSGGEREGSGGRLVVKQLKFHLIFQKTWAEPGNPS